MEKKLAIHILYEEVDNSRLGYETDVGWVDFFRRNIALSLERLLGYQPEILPVSDFDPKNKKTGVLYVALVVLSRQSCHSSKLNKQIEEFYNAFGENSWVANGVASRARIFKIMKEPLEFTDQPECLRELIAQQFYYTDVDAGKVKTFNPLEDDEIRREYWIKLLDIAYNINELLDRQKRRSQKAEAAAVYLADAGPDLTVQRQIIKRELERYGYYVLPNKSYPDDPAAAREKIRDDLQKCTMSIQLVGMYNESPHAGHPSLIELQHAECAAFNRPGFQKLIWTYPDIEFPDERQRMFFESIKREVEGRDDADLIQSSLEDFKHHVHQRLSNPGNPAAAEENANDDAPVIYLIYDRSDQKNGIELSKTFLKTNFVVLTPRFNGDFEELRQVQANYLKRFDAAIIYCKDCSEKWLQMQLMELMKAPAFGRNKPIFAKLLIDKNSSLDLNKIYNFDIDVAYIGEDQIQDADVIAEAFNDIDTLKMSKSY